MGEIGQPALLGDGADVREYKPAVRQVGTVHRASKPARVSHHPARSGDWR
jgi:hypothetical protein